MARRLPTPLGTLHEGVGEDHALVGGQLRGRGSR